MGLPRSSRGRSCDLASRRGRCRRGPVEGLREAEPRARGRDREQPRRRDRGGRAAVAVASAEAVAAVEQRDRTRVRQARLPLRARLRRGARSAARAEARGPALDRRLDGGSRKRRQRHPQTSGDGPRLPAAGRQRHVCRGAHAAVLDPRQRTGFRRGSLFPGAGAPGHRGGERGRRRLLELRDGVVGAGAGERDGGTLRVGVRRCGGGCRSFQGNGDRDLARRRGGRSERDCGGGLRRRRRLRLRRRLRCRWWGRRGGGRCRRSGGRRRRLALVLELHGTVAGRAARGRVVLGRARRLGGRALARRGVGLRLVGGVRRRRIGWVGRSGGRRRVGCGRRRVGCGRRRVGCGLLGSCRILRGGWIRRGRLGR